ncbi:MAG: FecR family protein [Paludibacter sp.]
MKIEIDNILARYFGGNASEDDMKALENWISESPENQQVFDQTTDLYEKLTTNQRNTPKPNTQAAKSKFLAYMSMHNDIQELPKFEIKHKPFYKKWMYQAASIAIFMILSYGGWKVFLSEHEMVLATQMALKESILPDKTQVKLSKNSKITYSSNFGKKNKVIRLEGEANFTVGHTGKGTLQIQANETFIEDIGTVFAVTAYPDSNFISVKVSKGSVRFYTKNDNGITLNSNETGTYNKQSKTFQVLAQKLDKKAEVGSMHIEFQGMMLKDAIAVICNAYNVKIKLEDASIGQRKITVNFDGEDVNVVLQIIAETLNLKLKKEANNFELSNQIIRTDK